MIAVDAFSTPNGVKVAVALGELGLDYMQPPRLTPTQSSRAACW
jgi:glutathione S-transferase